MSCSLSFSNSECKNVLFSLPTLCLYFYLTWVFLLVPKTPNSIATYVGRETHSTQVTSQSRLLLVAAEDHVFPARSGADPYNLDPDKILNEFDVTSTR